MIISNKQIMQLMQCVQTMACRYAAEGKEHEASKLISYLKEISDQQSEQLLAHTETEDGKLICPEFGEDEWAM